jgi:tetratricopeptide (TPR) repeat protein
MGQTKKACEILQQSVEQRPNSAYGYRNLGDALTVAGKLDEAWFALQRAQSLASGDYRIVQSQWAVHALRGRWLEADELAKKMSTSQDPSIRSRAMCMLATSSLHQGRHGMGLEYLDRAIKSFSTPGYSTSEVYNIVARTHLIKGNTAQALALAEKAKNEGKGHFPEWEGIFYSALAQARLGREAEARKTAEVLKTRTASMPTNKETRRYHHLLGLLALLEGDAPSAIEELELAASMLPARGLHFYPRVEQPKHIPIWCALGRAYLENGDEDRALRWFRRVSGAGTERLWWPVPHVRSFYYLGKIYERRGETDKAREHYRRFYEYWKDGDLDRDRVEEARRFLHST